MPEDAPVTSLPAVVPRPAATASATSRPAGTTALLYAVVSLVVAVVLGPVGAALWWWAPSPVSLPVVTAAAVAVVGALVALAVGVIKRLAGQGTELPDLRRVVVWVLLGPAVGAGVWVALFALAWLVP